MKWLIPATFLVLAGCVSEKPMPLDDGYQVGDATRTAIALQDEFCRTGDPVTEALLLVVLDELKPMTGGENLCEIDIPELIRHR